MAFSASEAAFEGFRILRREPKSIAAWAVLQLLVGAIVAAVMLPVMQRLRVVADLPSAGAARSAPSHAALSAVPAISLMYLILIPLYVLVFSLLSAAVYRSVLRPQDRGLGRLRLGGDEVRLAGLWLLLGAIYFVVSLAVLFLVGALTAGVVLAAKSSGADWIALVLVVLYLGLFIAFWWVGVRLSFAGPMTFAQRRIDLFGSWKLTKGRFWSLFGCYLLAWIFGLLLMLLQVAVVGAITLGASGGSVQAAALAMMRPDYGSFASYFSVARVASLVVAAPFAAVFWALIISPAAVAYREIAGQRPQDLAEAFA